MERGYFFVQPSCFSRYGDVDINGESEIIPCENFSKKDRKEDVIIFTFEFESDGEGETYPSTCTELISKNRFYLEYNECKMAGSPGYYVTFTSEDFGLESIPLPLTAIDVEPKRAYGLINSFEQRPELKKAYCGCLKEFFATAKAFKHIHDCAEAGVSKYQLARMRRAYKRARV